jgi:hypothetical protein
MTSQHPPYGMIRKNVLRLSEKIMPNQKHQTAIASHFGGGRA